MPDKRALGELAYNGYRDQTGGLTWNGYPMPVWTELTPAIREAWEAGASAVSRHVLADVIAMLTEAHQEEVTEEAALIAGQSEEEHAS